MARVKNLDLNPDLDVYPSLRRREDDEATLKAIERMKNSPGHAETVRKLDRMVEWMLIRQLEYRCKHRRGKPRVAV